MAFSRSRQILGLALLSVGIAAAGSAVTPGNGLIATTLRDFRQPGSQPGEFNQVLLPSDDCSGCHGNFNYAAEPYRRWAASMMAQAGRDPIFHAALAIAEQDADFAGDLCLRCHAPTAWLAGRTVPTDGSAMDPSQGDFDGVNCSVCHRMVDPVFDPENPAMDQSILAGLSHPPQHETHSGQFVFDPNDNRRGPFDLGPGFFWHDWQQSPFHRESAMCATCHDVSNPAISRQPGGGYALNALNVEHNTHNKRHEFPIERTFSEWNESVFAKGELDMGGRFGGNKPEVASCQDCHMPDTTGTACMDGLGGIERDDLPLHNFNGANSWVLRAVRQLYPDLDTGLDSQTVDDAIARNVAMLQAAADVSVHQDGSDLAVRIVNMSGHKLPTGYGEGRRMWLNVQFLDAGDQLVQEFGHYDDFTADLTTGNTKVYEIHHGMDATQAATAGLTPGTSFHFVLNNVVEFDNRIPPRGYDSAAFEYIQASPVGHSYDEQHYWDDTNFVIPAGATKVEVRLFHQTTSKEYIDFLKNENTTNGAGQLAWDMWDLFGKSAPVEMALIQTGLSALDCPETIPYGLGKINSFGERAFISSTGTPSVSANNFVVSLNNGRPGNFGALFWGDAARDLPFFGASLLVTNPVRGPVFSVDPSGGMDIPIAVTAPMVGVKRYYQFLFRDPGSSFAIGLTDGLYVEFCN
ncbi:MAG: hypothetical protein ACI841_003301 [Planctomycetota bacterium]|jgi:hypothetical protein